jgi:hypothetical protein
VSAQAEVVEIRWSGEGRFEHQATVAPAKFVELCGNQIDPILRKRTLRFGHAGRSANTLAFALAALELLEHALESAGGAGSGEHGQKRAMLWHQRAPRQMSSRPPSLAHRHAPR